uniref:Uncharacterized protein n=1 Tax=Ralstonia solanacearum TaxID=305 RepID=A0A0S4TMC0_RALSL|nr:protein of unknown function [Ralstonia solanacearum]
MQFSIEFIYTKFQIDREQNRREYRRYSVPQDKDCVQVRHVSHLNTILKKYGKQSSISRKISLTSDHISPSKNRIHLSRNFSETKCKPSTSH